VKTDRWAAFVAVLFSPPIGLVLGIAAALVLWFTLADAGLPGWARLALSLMAITALPGLWFLLLPILHLLPGAVRMPEPPGDADWAARQRKVWEQHHEALTALIDAPIRSIQAVGRTEEIASVRVTLLVLEVSEPGGCFWLQYALPAQEGVGLGSVDLQATVEDDIGRAYAVSARCLEASEAGGRCSIYFVPAPPAEARQLRLTIERLFVWGLPDAIVGPWSFQVEIEPLM